MDAKTHTLIQDMCKSYTTYNEYCFEYNHPGYFCYTKGNNIVICFTPEFDEKDKVSIQVTVNGEIIESVQVPFTKPLTARNLFQIVKPFLDRSSYGNHKEKIKLGSYKA